MNSDEKEDCECAPPQAETSPAEGPYRWGRVEERAGDAGDARRNTGSDSQLAVAGSCVDAIVLLFLSAYLGKLYCKHRSV